VAFFAILKQQGYDLITIGGISMNNSFYILEEDRKLAQARIIELERQIQELGPEFHVVLNQSTETWHDNAPFDALREKQALLAAELQKLKEVLQKASLAPPHKQKGIVGIGSRITIKLKGKIQKYLLTGHWSYRIGKEIDKALVISCQSPLGQAVLGKQLNESGVLAHNGTQLTITDIS
jgi:transcription elongation GreA/GreB family factor